MNETNFLSLVAHADEAVLTLPDGRPLTWMGQIAGAVYLTADFAKITTRFPRLTRQQHARMCALKAALR